MRYLFVLVLSCLALAGCGGGGGGSGGASGTTIPVGSISGIAFDGIVASGNVTAYDYSTGSKGAVLAQATTDANGLYSLPLKVEARPVLLELTNGSYIEEAGPKTNVTLGTGQKLQAVLVYQTGAAMSASITHFTYLAAGLAASEISKGTAPAAAITDANNRVTALAGINILTTAPKDVTNITNQRATMSPELQYGFLEAAISMWAYTHPATGATPLIPPYTSIDFAQLMYQDVAADGLLDGVGAAKAPLSFGSTALSQAVYRYQLGVAMMQMVGSANNKTTLAGALVLPYATAYIGSTDAMFGTVAPVPFPASVDTITSPASNAWARATVSVVPAISSPFGIKTVVLLVDGTAVQTLTNVPASISLNTTAYADGPHAIGLQATDFAGFVTTSPGITLKIDNTPPTDSVAGFVFFGTAMYTWGTVSDAYSGAAGTLVTSSSGQSIVTSATGGYTVGATTNPVVVRVRDVAGNCSDYTVTTGWTLTVTAVYGTCP